jgi:hypothetical protein
MKKVLSLALAITVTSLALISLPARSVRAQEVASAGKSIDEIKEEYERLLAIERDPSTPTEAREMNRTFLEARRAQLADALRKRIAALRRYESSVVTSLSDEERHVVEGSIQRLSAELQSLQPARSDPPARATRRPPASAQSRSVASQPKPAAPASGGGEAESADEQPTPDPVATRSRKAAAIEITSPDSDKTVHVGQIEVEVTVNDEDVDDIMVAVYTPGSGQKPATARTLELKRSDRGKKSFPVVLEAGENRIEVSDLKRGEVLATRTLTYAPARDVLNAPATADAQATPQPVETLLTKKLGAAQDTDAVICGQLQLASLNRTLALIRMTPELGDLAARFRPAGADPRRQYDDQITAARDTNDPAAAADQGGQDAHKDQTKDRTVAARNAGPDFLITSQMNDRCEAQTSLAPNSGLQRSAAIDLLNAVLIRLDEKLKPIDTPINNTALKDETAYVLQKTTSSVAVAAEAKTLRSAPAAGASAHKRAAGKNVPTTDLHFKPTTAFESLSSDTIRKQIAMLQQYLGNVEVTLTSGDKTYRTFSDYDGNFAFVIPATEFGAQDNSDKDNSGKDNSGSGKDNSGKDNSDGGGDNSTVKKVKAVTTTAVNNATNGSAKPTATGGAPKTFTLSTEGDQHYTTRDVTAGPGERVRVNLDIEDRPVSLLARTIVGYDQSGAAAAKKEQSFFFDFYISKSFPFHQKINPDFGENLKVWGDFRINSVPQTGEVTVGDFAGGGFTTAVSGLKVKDVARVFEVLGGIEYRLTGNNALLPSFDRQTKQKFSLSFIGSYGIVTPIDPLENAPTVFKVFEGAEGLPPAAKGKEFVAFVPVDRDRFFRQYYAGLRVQTFFFNKYNVPMQRFPAQFDLSLGQNEFVTGGRLHGPVIRMESFFPLPYEPMKFINLFATAQIIPGKPKIGTPLVLQPAPADTVVPAANVALVPIPQPNRDHYRIGIGIDFIPFFQKLLQPKTAGAQAGTGGGTTATPAPSPSGGGSPHED